MNIEDNETFEALCARFLPKFNEFLMRRSKNIFSCELATSLDGINSMPALYDKDGVRKQVIAPLTLLTKNIDEEIREVTEATAAAKNAAEKAEEATRQVSSAIDSTKQLVETVNEAEATRDESENTRIANEENRKAQEETRQEQEEVRIANEENRNTGEAERQRAEVARAEAEQKRVLDYATVKAAADKATENANSMAANPPYVDRDGYYYRWNVGTQSYDKTDVNLTGKAFVIKKVFTSIAEMTATDISTFNENDFILINTANTEDEDNAKLYVVAVDSDGNKFYSYLVDMSGFRGFTGKTPQMLVGTVTSLLEDEEPAVSVTPDDVDSEGNPKYKINFGIPRGKSLKYSDLTEEQLAELKKPATDAANESEEQTALCNAATFNANDAADMSSAQTLLCKEATDAAQEVIDKFSDLIAAINIDVTGDGNGIASVSQDGSKLKFTKNYFIESSENLITELDTKTKGLKVLSAQSQDYGNGYGVILQVCNHEALKYNLEPGVMNAWYSQIMANTDDELRFRTRTNGGSWTNWKQIIHFGNIGQQSVKNADMVDGYHVDECVNAVYKTAYTVSSPANSWIEIIFDAYTRHYGTINLIGEGDNKNSNFVAHCGARSLAVWGYQTNYNGGCVDYISTDIKESHFRLMVHITSGFTSLSIRATCHLNVNKMSTAPSNTYFVSTSFFCIGGYYYGNVSSSTSSDFRLKKNIHSLDCLSIIKDMGGTVGFEWKENNEKSIGFIAQRVQKNQHMKDLVTQGNDGYLKINYWSPKLIAVAFGAIEQVGGEIGKLKARIRKLEQKIKKLEKNSGE